ncbi:GID complex subunit containing RING finger motif [Friedmanniomyces endolithicus]|nr:GID complex subunit containing RING finger motif [Friedmanniomyces endolithicus]
MAELASTKLDSDSHLLLDQPLLRLPHELLRKNLKSAQRHIEIANKGIAASIQTLTTHSSPAETLAALDATLLKAQTLKRKLKALHAEEATLHRQQKARIAHLQELHDLPTIVDVKYDVWAQTRLDRLLVDYLLRQNYLASARQLAEAKGIVDLVDIPVFEECGRIEASLRGANGEYGDVREALGWCAENKQALKKIGSILELELRLQQFIELARTGEMDKLMEAIAHARKHFVGGQDTLYGLRAGGLLAHAPDTMVEPYKMMYAPTRYPYLAALFLRTHHTLFALPAHPLLHTALSAGLSALKTPTCHSAHNPHRGMSSLQHSSDKTTSTMSRQSVPPLLTDTPVCPICSTELNELARGVPYAHHTKSYMEDDPVVLPNGRVFGRDRLRGLNVKLGVPEGRVRDPTDGLGGAEWGLGEVRKVFIL